MSLTMGRGPLVARGSPESNYEIVGPKHRILWDEFPRRVRAKLGGATILDTTRGRLLHESQMLPVLYVPEADVAVDLLEPTETHTHCPFKGDACYWSIRVGDQLAEDAVWSYPEPLDEAPWLAGHLAFYWRKLDAWYDEDEEVHGHLRDPYHRVDVRPSSRPVVVSSGGQRIAASNAAVVVSETGLPNRIYLPLEDVEPGVIEPSEKRAHDPYIGDASYWSVEIDGERIENAAITYREPFANALRVAGLVSFLHDEIVTEVDAGPPMTPMTEDS